MVVIINQISDRNEFDTILNENEGVVILKFGATWCKPCKLITPFVSKIIDTLADSYTVYDLDIDDNFEIFAYLKSKRMLSGVPSMLAYKKGNVSFAPNELVSGTVQTSYRDFFIRCGSLT